MWSTVQLDCHLPDAADYCLVVENKGAQICAYVLTLRPQLAPSRSTRGQGHAAKVRVGLAWVEHLAQSRLGLGKALTSAVEALPPGARLSRPQTAVRRSMA
jgi:hypothetical protein